MQKTVDYYLFLLSPWSYIGAQRFNEVVAKHKLKVNYKPIDVMQTFEKMGGVPPMKRHPSRQRMRADELTRWSKYLNVPFNLKPAHWPTDQTFAAKMVLAAGNKDDINTGAFVDALLAAVWRHERDIADKPTLMEIATACELDAEALAQDAETDALAAQYQATTDEAHARDVFGSPTYIYNGENFWGQDRIGFLDRALGGDV